MSASLDEAAQAAGIMLEPRWGGAPPVPDATKEALIAALGAAPGAAPDPQPRREAFVPPVLDRERLFGVSLQLYQLRSPRNLGIGDLGDLKALIGTFAREGADFIGVNPLHALFTAAPENASPFSPSDRRFLNPLIIAADEVPGYRPAMRDAVFVPSTADMVDYTAAAAAKLSVLKAIHAAWRARDPAIPAGRLDEAARHRSEGGRALGDFALFEALSHKMVADGRGAGWTSWPADYAHRDSVGVRAFEEAHGNDVAFHAWLQYLAQTQLRDTQAAALAAGMRIGLYLDLAVGAAPDGASTWAEPSLVVRGIRIGAPPDLFSADGQDWGLAPLSPAGLAESGFASYRAILSAVMGHAGAARIDHAMGLERLFLIPDGIPVGEGAYVRMDGLLDVLIEESRRNRAIAIGEDLGVVPPGFRDRMAARRIFSMRILPFERDGAIMRPVSGYPADSLACLSTHDIAPLEAWWRGDDIEIRKAIGHLRPEDAVAGRLARAEERSLMCALAGLPQGAAEAPIDDAVVLAFHRIAARSNSRLVAVRLEDVVGGRRLVNLPGTDREHPNWRKTLPLTVAELTRSERLMRTFATMREERS